MSPQRPRWALQPGGDRWEWGLFTGYACCQLFPKAKRKRIANLMMVEKWWGGGRRRKLWVFNDQDNGSIERVPTPAQAVDAQGK